MDSRAKALIEQGNSLFEKRKSLVHLWQEFADNFYIERADFTTLRYLGEEFGENLTTSFPLLARRDLGNSFSAMLRPTEQPWFRMTTTGKKDNAGDRWMQQKTRVMYRAMYDRLSQFVRATKEADHDFAAFGQACLSIEMNRANNGLLYRDWHLRDVAWSENIEGVVDTFHRKWKPTARYLSKKFPDTIGQKVRDALDQNKGETEFEVRHVVIPTEDYDEGEKKIRQPFVSIYIDVESQEILEEEGSWNSIYVLPRWQTVSGSQYAYSPATVAALPDARLIQAMTLTLLEAGEKSSNPPMVATQEAVRSDLELYAGGVTWVDAEYDEKLGAALRPISQDYRGLPMGVQMSAATQDIISAAFYLNKLSLPPAEKDMTAFEVGQRIQEFIRASLPIFEPMELEYNGAVTDMTFDIMLRNGGFGAVEDIPRSLLGEDIQFRFSSPLHDAIERQDGQKFQEAGALLAQAAQMDQAVLADVDVRTAFRDALAGIGTPAKWLVEREEADAKVEAAQQQAAQAQALQAAGGVAEVAKTAAEADAVTAAAA